MKRGILKFGFLFQGWLIGKALESAFYGQYSVVSIGLRERDYY
jgi:hypothetical protein